MYYEVYIDIFFGINALLDFFVLMLVKKILCCKSSITRILLASMAGAGLLCLYLLIPFRGNGIMILCFYVGACLCMERIAFPDNTGKGRLQAVVVLYGVSFLVNGICHWLNLQVSHLWQLLLVLGGLYGLLSIVYTVYTRINKQEKSIYKVQIMYHTGVIRLKGLWDTGNRLVSPYHKRGVSIINYDSIREYLPDSISGQITKKYMIEGGEVPLKGIVYVPYETVGCRHGLMPVIEAQRMVIETEKGQLEYQKPLLGISRSPVSSRGTFQIILTTQG